MIGGSNPSSPAKKRDPSWVFFLGLGWVFENLRRASEASVGFGVGEMRKESTEGIFFSNKPEEAKPISLIPLVAWVLILSVN
jgi:hypothetical protein